MSGCQCSCGRRLVKAFSIYGLTYVTFSTGTRMYRAGIDKQIDQLEIDVETLDKDVKVTVASVAALKASEGARPRKGPGQ